MINEELPDEALSDDPEENLRMENELLKLKLKAELGGESYSDPELDPEIENEFLKNVLQFENNFANSKPVKVYDLLGKPAFTRSDEVSDDLLEQALQQITGLMAEKNIEIYFGDGYDDRTKYHFITEELFEHESYLPPMPGMTTHFDYEEFHPNHKKDIENSTISFLSGWFKQSVEECGRKLSQHAILPGSQILTRPEVLKQIECIFEAYTAFTDEKYSIFDIGFDLNAGMGHAEGGLKYKASIENVETVAIGGPFKLYFSLENGYWSIVYMVLPGFKYF